MSDLPDLLHFYAYYGSGDIAFAMPTSAARHRVSAVSSELTRRGISREIAVQDAERSIEHGIRSGLQNGPDAERLGQLVMLNCLMSAEAAAFSEGRGFLMEIGHALAPSWLVDVTISLQGSDFTLPLKTYYAAVKGKAEVDAVMLSRRARVAARGA